MRAATLLAVEGCAGVGILLAGVIFVFHTRRLGGGSLNLAGIKLNPFGGRAGGLKDLYLSRTAGCTLAPGLGSTLLCLNSHVPGVSTRELLHSGGRLDAHGLRVGGSFLGRGQLGNADGVCHITGGLFLEL